MSLKEVAINEYYTYLKNNLLEEFYIPVLSESFSYKRIAGYFSSNALAIAAKGIARLIEKGGTIEIIACVVLSQEDQTAIDSALRSMESELIEEITGLEDKLKQDHIRMLSWLIKTGKLKMKIAIVPTGLEHRKKGIFEDIEGNKVCFSGSNNETLKGWLHNDEEFHVYRSWIPGDKPHLDADVTSFDDLWSWEGHGEKVKVYPVSEAFELGLIQIAPKDDVEFRQLSREITEELIQRNREIVNTIRKSQTQAVLSPIPVVRIKEFSLREYQEQAVHSWYDEGKQGFLQMATGTGKTETAIGIIKRVIQEEDSVFIVIAVAGNSLLSQWVRKLREYGLPSEGASSNFSKWRDNLKKDVHAVSMTYKDFAIWVTTYQTFSSQDFVGLVSELDTTTLLICDEAHHVGAPQFRQGLLPIYKYRLGLSATPDRWFDDEGTKTMHNYFGKTVYEFSMQRALREINPSTGQTFLCKYNYYPQLVPFTIEESELFISYGKKIAQRAATLKKFDLEDPIIKDLIRKRTALKNNAVLKLDAFEKLLDNLGEQFTRSIVYCTGDQMGKVKEILQSHGKVYHEYTQHYNDPAVRDKLLKDFEAGRSKGGYDILLAIDCLNEGIDIPSAQIGVFLENSQNPMEFIQRRGRLLRQDGVKTHADAYDFIVKPNFSGSEGDKQWESERKELQKEFNRFLEFAHLAQNTEQAMKIMESVIKEFNLVFNIGHEDL